MKQVNWQKDTSFAGGMGSLYFEEEEMARIIPNYDYGHALAYLWRRFGPPMGGCDPYKDLIQYILTTEMDGVYLTCKCYLSAHIAFGFGLPDAIVGRMSTLVEGRKIPLDCNLPKNDWPEYLREVWRALLRAVEELKRPVNVRDWFINIEGKVKDGDDIKDPAKYSDKAGYGIIDEYYERFKSEE